MACIKQGDGVMDLEHGFLLLFLGLGLTVAMGVLWFHVSEKEMQNKEVNDDD